MTLLRVYGANVLFLLAGMGLMALAHAAMRRSGVGAWADGAGAAGAAPVEGRNDRVAAPGPWGELRFVDFALEEPEALLPDVREKLPAARWVFAGYAPDAVWELFSELETSAATRSALQDRRHWEELADGVVVHPTREVLLGLGRPARQRLYPLLGESRFNFSHYHPFRFRAGGFDAWLKVNGLGPEAAAMVQDLTYTNRAGALCLVDIDLLQERLGPSEFRRLQQTLFSEPSVLLSLHVPPDADVSALAAYWGRGGREAEVRAILKSIARLPGGGSLSVTHLLPSFPRSRLYAFHQDTNAAAIPQDCFWSAVHFFRTDPDPRLTVGRTPQDLLASDYVAVTEAPRLGDVLLFRDGGESVHACVYIADDVVFTKNGAGVGRPWVLMKLADVRAGYSSDRALSIATLRLKQPPS